MFNSTLAYNPSDGTSKRFSIPIVQELASQNLQSLPERYIRPQEERPNEFPPPQIDIPIIDIGMLLSDSNDLCRQKELEKLGIACQQWGFFQRNRGSIRFWSNTVLWLLSENAGLKPDCFINACGKIVQRMRMNYYPPCPRPDLVLGLSSHSDGNGLTVLLQDDETVGLQVCKDGQWIPVQSIPGALVINIGDMLEILSNGIYKSAEHRAVTNMDKDRISIAMFYGPSMGTEVGPVPELIDEMHPCQYKRFIRAEYMQKFFSGKLEGKKKKIEFVKIKS